MPSHILSVLTALSFVSIVSAQISNSSIPMQCMSMCGPVIQLLTICDVDGSLLNPDMSTITSPMPSMSASMPTTATSGILSVATATAKPSNSTSMGSTEAANMDMAKANPMAEMAAGIDGSVAMNAGAKLLRRKRDYTNGMEDMSDARMAGTTCFCDNKSFDVAKIIGLCAGCVDENADASNAVEKDINAIMRLCKFSNETYTPSSTSALKDVTVQATKPVIASGSSTGTADMNGTSSASRIEIVASAIGFGLFMVSLGTATGILLGVI